MANMTEDQIKQMYEAQLKSQNEQLTNDYNTAASNLDAQKQQNQQVTDVNLNRTAVEAQKRALNDEEYYAAAGLTSGARAQARMARENQLMSDMATIRAAQQAADADVERLRGLLAKEYDSAIRKAQADDDLALAQALYKQATQEEQTLLTQQKETAKLMAGAGDYSLYAQLYGLTPEQVEALRKRYAADVREPYIPQGYLSPEQVQALIEQALAEKGSSTTPPKVTLPGEPAAVDSGMTGNKGADLGVMGTTQRLRPILYDPA